MSIPHFKNSDPVFAENLGFGLYRKDTANKFNWYMHSEEVVQKEYLIHLIKKKTPDPSEKIMQLIETNDLKNIELAYLLTYSNEES